MKTRRFPEPRKTLPGLGIRGIGQATDGLSSRLRRGADQPCSADVTRRGANVIGSVDRARCRSANAVGRSATPECDGSHCVRAGAGRRRIGVPRRPDRGGGELAAVRSRGSPTAAKLSVAAGSVENGGRPRVTRPAARLRLRPAEAAAKCRCPSVAWQPGAAPNGSGRGSRSAEPGRSGFTSPQQVSRASGGRGSPAPRRRGRCDRGRCGGPRSGSRAA
jgi:hypothetical protein